MPRSGRPVVVERFLVAHRTVVHAHVAEQVGGHGSVGIGAYRLDIEIQADGQVGIFLHAGDLRRVQVGRQCQVLFVMFLEILPVSDQRLPQFGYRSWPRCYWPQNNA